MPFDPKQPFRLLNQFSQELERHQRQLDERLERGEDLTEADLDAFGEIGETYQAGLKDQMRFRFGALLLEQWEEQGKPLSQLNQIRTLLAELQSHVEPLVQAMGENDQQMLAMAVVTDVGHLQIRLAGFPFSQQARQPTGYSAGHLVQRSLGIALECYVLVRDMAEEPEPATEQVTFEERARLVSLGRLTDDPDESYLRDPKAREEYERRQALVHGPNPLPQLRRVIANLQELSDRLE